MNHQLIEAERYVDSIYVVGWMEKLSMGLIAAMVGKNPLDMSNLFVPIYLPLRMKKR